MGTGIMGVIPISFRFGGSIWRPYSVKDAQENKEEFTKHAPADFFDFYNEKSYEEHRENKVIKVTSYEIKPEVLLPNFKDFFYEFHKLIDDNGRVEALKGYDKFNDEYAAAVGSNDLDKFVKYFDDHTGYAPTIFPYFGAEYIVSRHNLLVYQGSYKALLEEESSLLHMERLLWAAMKHPLAKVTRIGMSL
ncbi:MAG: hypothetical protein LBF67_00405 [Prevotellaceae bacterium]|jgi:hypothetical protein|nr:hypothetical protein [Prevotellaceae bacterium]